MSLRDHERARRRREYERMLAALRRGTPSTRIPGDRDVLAAAVDAYRRERFRN